MPHLPLEPSGDTSGDLVVYPVELMREAAAQILVQASNAQSQ